METPIRFNLDHAYDDLKYRAMCIDFATRQKLDTDQYLVLAMELYNFLIIGNEPLVKNTKETLPES